MNAQDDCFCDLAPLYALGVLPEAECAYVTAQLANEPELAVELAEFQAAAAAIAYSVPVVPLAGDLKARLFQQLAVALPTALPPAETAPVMSFAGFAIHPEEMIWSPHPTPGVTIAILHTDAVKREVVGLLKAEPGVRYPWHAHAAIEDMFMLEGDLQVGDAVYGKGSYIHSGPGSMHAPETTTGCMFFFRTSMDDDYSIPSPA
jgi:ChrR Cupin-like domain